MPCLRPGNPILVLGSHFFLSRIPLLACGLFGVDSRFGHQSMFLLLKPNICLLSLGTHFCSRGPIMGLGTHLWSLGPILHPETCVLVLDPYFGCPPCTKCAPGANRAPWCTGARSSVHPRRPEHAPRCTRPTCERRSLRPRWCVGTALQTGHCTHTTPRPGART